MTQVKWVYVALYSTYFVNFFAVIQSVNPNKVENVAETHRKRHNNTLDRSTNTTDISRKERFPSNLEYRLMRMEVQFIEKFDRINSEIRESNNRLQNLEWQYAETQRSIDSSLPMLEAYIRQQPHQNQHQSPSTPPSTPPPPPSVVGTIDDRLNKLAEATANLIATSRVFYRDIVEIKGNISSIAVMTKNIYDGSHNFLTTSTLNKALKSAQFSSSSSSLSSSIISKLSQQCQQHHNNRTHRANCLEILDIDSSSRSGIYQIRPNPGVDPIMVYCDMSTSGGGWTVIQNRYDGSQDFYRPWPEYKRGFGNIGGEFWLGLDNIHALTDAVLNELLVELEDQDGVRVLAGYAAFSIGSEMERYRLRVLTGYQDMGYNTVVYEERSGDFGSRRRSRNNNNTVAEEDSIAAGDSLSYHAGSRFSTFDVDEDNWLEGNCAQSHGGGWWYNQCDRSNLNGRYLQPVDQVGDPLLPEQLAYHGMYWHTFHGPRYSLRKARMLIRPTMSVAQDDGIRDPAENKVSGEDNDDLQQMVVDLFSETD